MTGRWCLCAALALAGAGGVLHAETRRALLVGIDQYEVDAATPRPQPSDALSRIPVQGAHVRRSIRNLDGAVSDALLMRDLLIERFDFPKANIRLLQNEQATADEILGLLKQMIESSSPDDILVFYYAGHGSEIRNTKTRDGWDQTLVPADAQRGAPDVRDKEIARLLRIAVERKLRFTLIADSCHSGSIARGPVGATGKVRGESPVEGEYVEDPVDTGPDGKPLPAPEENGVVVLAAAQSYQLAKETTEHQDPHGLFTYSLVQALSTAPDAPAADVFARTRALMHAEASDQDPSIAGLVKGREKLGIFGQPVAEAKKGIAVVSTQGGDVTLQGGFVMGLTAGCELTRAGSSGEIRLEVAKTNGPSSSVAKVTSGSIADVHAGDMFEVTSWASPQAPLMRVYVPPAYPKPEGLSATADVVRRGCEMARAEFISDPTVSTPTHSVWWDANGWKLVQTATGESVLLKDGFSATEFARALKGARARVAIILPPPVDLLTQLGLGAGRMSGIKIVSSPPEAQYLLIGRPENSTDGTPGPSYAWVLPSEDEQSWKREDEEAIKDGGPLATHVLPLRTDWIAGAGDGEKIAQAAKRLDDAALRIARIRGWMELAAPESSKLSAVHLGLLPENSSAPTSKAALREKERYKLVLYPDDTWRSGILPQWIYVFVISSDGSTTVLFPPTGQGDVDNSRLKVPEGTTKPVPLFPDADYLEISAPFGTDTYFLLQTRDPLGDPQVLEGAAVKEGSRGVESPINQLIQSAISGSRGATVRVPSGRWSIEKLTFRSVSASGT